MVQSRKHGLALLFLAVCAGLAVGCFGGTSNPGSFPFYLPPGDVVRTHAKPPGWGYFSDFDRHAKRLEVRPADCTMPVRGQQVLIATIFDENGKPRRKRRVEWILEGPGNIIEVDESGYLPGRGYKVDNKYAVSYTDFFEHRITRGNDDPNDDFTIGPGQSWCVITSAVEGLTSVTVYAPAIADWASSRVFVKTHWVDARWDFPSPATAKAGTEHVFVTKVLRNTDQTPLSNYRVRYRVLADGPPAALYPAAIERNGTPQEATVIADADGAAKVTIQQPKAQFGANRIAIEVLKPDANAPGGFVLVGQSETKIEWSAPKLDLTIQSPKTALLNQDFTMTYGVMSAGSVATQDIVVRAVIPQGLQVVTTTPKATSDRGELLWSLPALPGGKQHTLQVVYRPSKTGTIQATADAHTTDNLTAQSQATLQVNEAKLLTTVQVPSQVLVGEKLAVQVTVQNPGNGPATNIHIKPQFDAGLEAIDKTAPENIIETIAPGEKQTVTLMLMPKQVGRAILKISTTGDGNLLSETSAQTLDVKQPELQVQANGPPRAYLNQDVIWTIRVFNPSEVTLQNVVARAALPPEVSFKSASNGGKVVGGNVEWNLNTMVAKQWTDLQLTTTASKLTSKAVLSVGVNADPALLRDGQTKLVALVKPFKPSPAADASVEILGIPALQMEVFDSSDPVTVGKRITYTVRVKNAGTLAAAQVELTVDLPAELKPVKAFGPTNGKIEGQKITFPAVDSIRAGAISAFTIDADALTAGTANFRAELRSLSLTNPIRVEEATRILPK